MSNEKLPWEEAELDLLSVSASCQSAKHSTEVKSAFRKFSANLWLFPVGLFLVVPRQRIVVHRPTVVHPRDIPSLVSFRNNCRLSQILRNCSMIEFLYTTLFCIVTIIILFT